MREGNMKYKGVALKLFPISISAIIYFMETTI